MRLRLRRAGEPRIAVYRVSLVSFGLATNAAKRDPAGMIRCRGKPLNPNIKPERGGAAR
jgi:hypothetical protein